MLPYADRAYVNYVDSRIADYLDAYYGPNLPRLVEVKRRVDPDDFFSFEQSIPTSLPAPA
jgi:FAD/FMN-containing dehydrogenase